MDAMGIGELRDALVMAEQVHGTVSLEVDERDAGRGAYAAGRIPAVAGTDALSTAVARLPLMLCFADCVPVVVVAPGLRVSVVHAGWRGAIGGIAGLSARSLAAAADCSPSRLVAYVGPHIGACHYEVDVNILSQFVEAFGTVARAESGGLDLGSAVAVSLTQAGVDPCNIASLGTCTAEATDRFFSHRAEAGLTGRHGALACIL
jgi:YfiH family protein